MQWILPIFICLGYFWRLSKCQPTVRIASSKPFQWRRSQGELAYPQLYSADSVKVKSLNSNNHSLLVLRTKSETFYIKLKPNEDLLKLNTSSSTGKNSTKSCHYHGIILSHADGMAAISICEPRNKMTGTIMLRNEAFIIRPLAHIEDNITDLELRNSSEDEIEPHVISKVEDPLTQYCGVEHNVFVVHPEENEINSRHRVRRSNDQGLKVIKTAIYVDYPLYKKFVIERKQTLDQFKDTILAIINQVQIIYNYQSLKIKFKIRVVKMEFLKEGKDAPDPAEGDIDKYLDNFCSWQSLRNLPESSEHHWDHALMLSGYDLHKVTDGKKNRKVLGLAWVNGMCRPKHSCTLNEGSSFEAAFVIAHEMGHSLGMLHDGTLNDCDPASYLMAEKTGPGRITWSKCSNEYLERFFKKGRGWCLEDHNSSELDDIENKFGDQLPGQRFNLDDQCKLSLGKQYKPHVMPKAPFNNVCRELWCVSGLWASVAHPALEGSSCGNKKQCIQGMCEASPTSVYSEAIKDPIEEVHGQVLNFMNQLKWAFQFMVP